MAGAPEIKILMKIWDNLMKDANGDPVNNKEGERICRRAYGYNFAFAHVHHEEDWKRPRGEGSRNWKSKVRWNLLNDLDLGALEANSGTAPLVDAEVAGR